MTQSEVAFMGKMTARMTHELRNILSILKESSGLMSDILSLNRNVTFPNRDKMEISIDRIQGQILRGMDLLTQFNRLAHSMDESEATVEINDFASHVAALMECFIRLKKVQLETFPAEDSIVFKTDPFRLHWVLSSCIDYVLKEIPEGDKMVLRLGKTERGPQFKVFYGSNAKLELSPLKVAIPPELTYLENSVNTLNARLSTYDTPGIKGVVLDVGI